MCGWFPDEGSITVQSYITLYQKDNVTIYMLIVRYYMSFFHMCVLFYSWSPWHVLHCLEVNLIWWGKGWPRFCIYARNTSIEREPTHPSSSNLFMPIIEKNCVLRLMNAYLGQHPLLLERNVWIHNETRVVFVYNSSLL